MASTVLGTKAVVSDVASRSKRNRVSKETRIRAKVVAALALPLALVVLYQVAMAVATPMVAVLFAAATLTACYTYAFQLVKVKPAAATGLMYATAIVCAFALEAIVGALLILAAPGGILVYGFLATVMTAILYTNVGRDKASKISKPNS